MLAYLPVGRTLHIIAFKAKPPSLFCLQLEQLLLLSSCCAVHVADIADQASTKGGLCLPGLCPFLHLLLCLLSGAANDNKSGYLYAT